ncbi:MAG: class I SAM-dependent methyltransferase [Thermodesulfobacteriota bacterium]
MPFTLDSIVPWGRSFKEYAAMFGLTETDLRGRILGCGDGPASFNATLTKHGGRVISVDPLYGFSAGDIRRRIRETFDTVVAETRKNASEFVWTSIRDPDELGRVRMAAMEDFLADYPEGLAQGRYVDPRLPRLPFADGSFDLALCSHLLFLYSEHLDIAFHLASIRELCRTAAEARVFPLLELGAKPSRHLPDVCNELRRQGYAVEILGVDYQFQKGGNRMMRIRR